jgi:hypothetical protein
MLYTTSRLLAVTFMFCLSALAMGQTTGSTTTKEIKPYKVLVAGKQVTVKSNKAIQQIMLWTHNGDRLVEQRQLNTGQYSFTIPISGNIFYLMIGLTNGKVYTERIGIR